MQNRKTKTGLEYTTKENKERKKTTHLMFCEPQLDFVVAELCLGLFKKVL
jgi:hypothetical protein